MTPKTRCEFMIRCTKASTGRRRQAPRLLQLYCLCLPLAIRAKLLKLGGREVTQRAVRPHRVVVLTPGLDDAAGIG
jgi:hypothetical protein